MTGALRAAIVVLGDVGRSPRMLQHARALADCGVAVDVIGYRGEQPARELRDHPRIRWHLLPAPTRARRLLPARLLFRVAGDLVRLAWVLLARVERPDVLLVQTPPAFPALWVVRAVATLRSSRMVVDWHNLGTAVLALRLGRGHPLVRLSGWLERRAGRSADRHLCVSRALQRELEARWGIARATVFCDRPIQLTSRPPPAERARLTGDATGARAVLITASSWTADEDLGLLAEACRLLDEAAAAPGPGARSLPDVLVLATGKGEGRAAFERRISALALRRVEIRTTWVEAEEYPALLASADVGLCLHRSASGLDLPMKLADMRGARLPICALDYGEVLREQVRPGEDVLLFRSAEELAGQLVELLTGFPDGARLRSLRAAAARRDEPGWAEGWQREARDVLLSS